MTAATGRLTRLGVLTPRGHALETLAPATHIVFDKTGTLTSGQLSLAKVQVLAEVDEQQCLSIAAALEQASEHPVARLLVAQVDKPLQVNDLIAVPGQGIEGQVEGKHYRIGRTSYALGGSEHSLEVSSQYSHAVLADRKRGVVGKTGASLCEAPWSWEL